MIKQKNMIQCWNKMEFIFSQTEQLRLPIRNTHQSRMIIVLSSIETQRFKKLKMIWTLRIKDFALSLWMKLMTSNKWEPLMLSVSLLKLEMSVYFNRRTVEEAKIREHCALQMKVKCKFNSLFGVIMQLKNISKKGKLSL